MQVLFCAIILQCAGVFHAKETAAKADHDIIRPSRMGHVGFGSHDHGFGHVSLGHTALRNGLGQVGLGHNVGHGVGVGHGIGYGNHRIGSGHGLSKSYGNTAHVGHGYGAAHGSRAYGQDAHGHGQENYGNGHTQQGYAGQAHAGHNQIYDQGHQNLGYAHKDHGSSGQQNHQNYGDHGLTRVSQASGGQDYGNSGQTYATGHSKGYGLEHGKTYGTDYTRQYGHDDSYSKGSRHGQHSASHGAIAGGVSDHGQYGSAGRSGYGSHGLATNGYDTRNHGYSKDQGHAGNYRRGVHNHGRGYGSVDHGFDHVANGHVNRGNVYDVGHTRGHGHGQLYGIHGRVGGVY